MTREEAIKIIGEEWIKEVEKENCECDCYVTNNNTRESWSATIFFNHGNYILFPNGEEYRGIKAVYYMDGELTKNTEDLGLLDWEIDHYELIE